MNVIYDIAGSHFETVKASFLASAPEGTSVSRVFSEVNIVDYCLSNNVQILIVPYSGQQYNYSDVMRNGTHVFVAGKGFSGALNSTKEEFGCPISVGGGDTETINTGGGAEVYTEALNLSLPQRHYTSYTCAYLAGLALSSGLLDSYTPFEFKQIVRQNGSQYPIHSESQGFGKVTSITDKTLDESLDVMNIQTYFCNGRNNLVFKRVKLPEYYSGTLSFYVDGVDTDPEFIFTDSVKKEAWIFWKSNGTTNQTTFTATFFEPEVYNTGTIGANVSSYVINDVFPVFNETFVYGSSIIHRGNAGSSILENYQDAMKVRVYDNDEVVYEGVSYSNSAFSTSNIEAGQQVTFQVFANGELYPETDPYYWDGSAIAFNGTIYNPNPEPEPEPEPEPDPEPSNEDSSDLTPVINDLRRDGSSVSMIIDNTVSAKVFRKTRIEDDWVLINTITGTGFTDTVDPTKNYIYSYKLDNGVTESDYSEPSYVACEQKPSYSIGAI